MIQRSSRQEYVRFRGDALRYGCGQLGLRIQHIRVPGRSVLPEVGGHVKVPAGTCFCMKGGLPAEQGMANAQVCGPDLADDRFLRRLELQSFTRGAGLGLGHTAAGQPAVKQIPGHHGADYGVIAPLVVRRKVALIGLALLVPGDQGYLGPLFGACGLDQCGPGMGVQAQRNQVFPVGKGC